MFLPLRKAPTLAAGSGEEGELGKAAGATCQNGSRGSIPDTNAVASVKSQSDWAPPLSVSKSPEPQPEAPSASVAPSTTARHYLVIGNCSLIDAKPNGGLKIVGEKGGYASKEGANQAMKDEAKCKVVETGAVEQDEAFKLNAAEAKARMLGGVHKLTQEDIKGYRTYEQIKQLRGY
jgi:hypothetical protein